MCVLIKDEKILINIMKFWKKLAILSKTKLIENLYMIKNI